MIDFLNPDFKSGPDCGRNFPAYALRSDANVVPDISILTPYFNTEEIFFETVKSIFSQSFQNWEWIIVDDGSTDDASILRLSEVAQMDARVKVFRQSNRGPSAARNHAFSASTARYVCIIDSDDLLEPTYFEKCLWFLESNIEFGFCNSYSVVFGDSQYLWKLGFERGAEHTKANSGPPISVLRREVFSANGGFDEAITFGHEDWDFWLSRAQAGHWGHTIPEYLQWYRKRGAGRFEQVMRSGEVNAKFESFIAHKYRGLDKCFPLPCRKHPSPYENLNHISTLKNPLAKGANVRSFLFLIPWMVTGGADRVNLDIVEGLVNRGHHVGICATLEAEHRWMHEFSKFTSDIFILPHVVAPSDYPRFLIYLIKSRAVDTVLISGSMVGYHLLPYLRSVCPDVAFIDMCHVEELHWLNGGHPRFATGYQGALDLNIVTTRHLANWMVSRGAAAERIEVMYTGIRCSQAQYSDTLGTELRSELKVPDGVPVIVFAGRMCEQKRPLLLGDILTRLRDQGVVYHAIVIGDGELRNDFLGKIVSNKLEGVVTAVSSVSHEKWLQVLRIADVLLMPSQYEGISVALLEAMASGVVPVVARVGGQPEIVTDEVGFAVDQAQDQVASYSEAIGRVLGDDELRERLSVACVDVCSHRFSWTKMIDRFLLLADTAHHFRVTEPRVSVSPALGLELASMALEYKRLSEAVDWLWHRQLPGDSAGVSVVSPEAKAFVNVAAKFTSTRIFRMVTSHKKLRKIAVYVYRSIFSKNIS